MTTKLLTPKYPATIGFWQLPPAPILGWKLGQDNAVDVMTSVNTVVAVAEYRGELLCYKDLTVSAANVWVVKLTKRDHPPVEAEGNKWIVFDGLIARALDHDFVIAFYDITDAPPAVPQSEPAQEVTP